MTERDELADFTIEPFTDAGATRDVYWQGEGPAVVVMTEMPGITPSVAAFARRVVEAGFTVALPHLFGDDGRPPSAPYIATSLAKGCVSKEFVAFATGRTSPVAVWLRALAVEAERRAGGGGVGVVGMCFTGGFALALATEPVVRVPVLSQPSLPLPVGRRQRHDLGLSPDDLRAVTARAAAGEICAIGLRFTEDPAVPAARFERLREELGDAFVGVEIDSGSGNAHGFSKRAHSVLTEEYDAADGSPTRLAFDLVIDHFKERLG